MSVHPYVILSELVTVIYKLFGRDFHQCLEREKIVYSLVDHKIKEEITNNPSFQEIADSISDDFIIYLKGEGAELVVDKDGRIQPMKGIIHMCRYFIAKRIGLLKERLVSTAGDSFLDIGATNGVFLKVFNKTGTGFNISEKAVQGMRDGGITADLGNAEELPYPNNSFDYIFSFQTLEHVENPIRALREIARVCKKKVFITIPYLSSTRLCGYKNIVGIHRCHVFEFNREDFLKIADRAGLKLNWSYLIQISGRPRSLTELLYLIILDKKYGVLNPYWFFEMEPKIK